MFNLKNYRPVACQAPNVTLWEPIPIEERERENVADALIVKIVLNTEPDAEDLRKSLFRLIPNQDKRFVWIHTSSDLLSGLKPAELILQKRFEEVLQALNEQFRSKK